MADQDLLDFFDAIFDNEEEKMIVKLLSLGINHEELIEILLGIKKEE